MIVATPKTAPKKPWYLPAFSRRDEIADHGQRDHDQPATPEPLHGAERDQLRHVLCEPAQR